jgi:hypothetical protein
MASSVLTDNDSADFYAFGNREQPCWGDDDAAGGTDVCPNHLVGHGDRQHLAQLHDIVPASAQHDGDFDGDVVVEEELHFKSSAICSATSASISPR